LSAKLAKGNALSISELFNQHENELRRYAIRLSGDPDQANDLVSETFLRAMAHLDLLNGLNSYQRRAWLFRVLKNRFIDERRAGQREQTVLAQMAWNKMLATPANLAQEMINEIPDRFRGLLYKHYTLGLTSEEIGRQLGVPAATIRSRLRLAIQWLRSHNR
jgi:RNA polymerase sigma-70 factor (ECF subfamily)